MLRIAEAQSSISVSIMLNYEDGFSIGKLNNALCT